MKLVLVAFALLLTTEANAATFAQRYGQWQATDKWMPLKKTMSYPKSGVCLMRKSSTKTGNVEWAGGYPRSSITISRLSMKDPR